MPRRVMAADKLYPVLKKLGFNVLTAVSVIIFGLVWDTSQLLLENYELRKKMELEYELKQTGEREILLLKHNHTLERLTLIHEQNMELEGCKLKREMKPEQENVTCKNENLYSSNLHKIVEDQDDTAKSTPNNKHNPQQKMDEMRRNNEKEMEETKFQQKQELDEMDQNHQQERETGQKEQNEKENRKTWYGWVWKYLL